MHFLRPVSKLQMCRLVRHYGQHFRPIEHVNFGFFPDLNECAMSVNAEWVLCFISGVPVLVVTGFSIRSAWALSPCELKTFGILVGDSKLV